jgi:hypothetical protein
MVNTFMACRDRGAYENAAPPQSVIGAPGAQILCMEWIDDGFFRYDVYELHLQSSSPFTNAPSPDDVVFGGFARYLGHDGGLELWQGRRVASFPEVQRRRTTIPYSDTCATRRIIW